MTQPADALLLPILHAQHKLESEERLARLITEHAAPVIRNVIRGKLHVFGDEHPLRQEAEDPTPIPIPAGDHVSSRGFRTHGMLRRPSRSPQGIVSVAVGSKPKECCDAHPDPRRGSCQ
jgi:hypothetical protein